MAARRSVRDMARMVAEGMAHGAPKRLAIDVGAALAEAGATPEIIACLLAEAGKKRPSEAIIEACGLLLEAALTRLRISASGGSSAARAALAKARDAVTAAVGARDLAPFTLILIARAVAQAGLEVEPALQQAMMRSLEDPLPPAPPPPGSAEMAEHLAPLAAALGHDPFAIHAELMATGAAFGVQHRAAMAAELAGSKLPALREAAFGFLLEADPAPGLAVLEMLEAQARDNPVSSRLLEWLVRLRAWLPAARQPALDHALRALRPHALPPVPPPRPEVTRLLASMCDGAGAQSFFALLKTGRRLALAACFVKEGTGVADAWLREDLSRREADRVLREITRATEAVAVPVSFFALRLADALAVNLARQAPPPFGLLRLAEAMGLGLVQPEAQGPASLAAQLLADQPAAAIGPEAVQAAHAAAAIWPERFTTLASWFEGDEAVAALLKPIRPRGARIAALRTRLLPGRRAVWAGRCAWMAATLRASAPADDQDWRNFALVARDLAADQPCAEIPLFDLIAAATVDAFAAGAPRRRPR